MGAKCPPAVMTVQRYGREQVTFGKPSLHVREGQVAAKIDFH